MSKIITKMNKFNPSILKTEAGLKKFQKLREEILDIEVVDEATYKEIKKALITWKTITKEAIEPFTVEKKEEYVIYSKAQQDEKEAKHRMDEIKTVLIQKNNDYIAPILLAEEKAREAREAAERKEADRIREANFKYIEDQGYEEGQTKPPTPIEVPKRILKVEKTIDTSGLRKSPDKYEVIVNDISLLDENFVIKTANNYSIIEAYKEADKNGTEFKLKGITVIKTAGIYQ